MQKAQTSAAIKLELLGLFVFLPILLALPIAVLIKVAVALAGLVYVGAVMHQQKWFSWRLFRDFPSSAPWRSIFIRFGLFAVITTALVTVFLPERLFIVPLQNPLLWLIITVIYTVLSVWPQELLYRHFFIHRYGVLFSSPVTLILVNAALFSLAHLFFYNAWVLALTFAGGILFTLTYRRTQSLMVTSVEHSLYGLWLFTVGLGEMLAFPGP